MGILRFLKMVYDNSSVKVERCIYLAVSYYHNSTASSYMDPSQRRRV